jgi:hypothetical protein
MFMIYFHEDMFLLHCTTPVILVEIFLNFLF